MKKVVFTTLCTLFALLTDAQESETAYNFLRLPVSAHAAALGGDNISLNEDDASLIFHNPALLNFVASRSVDLNFMTYMEGSRTASAAFVKGIGERASWGVSGQFMDYGTMKETTYDNQELGDFSARDISVAASFAYALTDRISGGITAKWITSSIGAFNSMAVGVDLGLNYVDSVGDLSISAVARNLGGQVDAYEEEFEKIPFDLQLGVTKRLVNSPFRFSATLTRLTDWSDKKLIRHLVVGADVLIGSNIYLAAGYNFRRAHEMKITDDEGATAHGAGFSVGAGISLERFKLHLGYGKYHVSASSLLVNVSYAF